MMFIQPYRITHSIIDARQSHEFIVILLEDRCLSSLTLVNDGDC